MTRLKKNAIIVLLMVSMQLLLFGCATTPTGEQGTEASEPTRTTTAITSVDTMDTADGAQVRIHANAPVTFSSLKQPDPLAVVLYFPQTTVQSLPADQKVDSEQVVRLLARDGINNSGTARIEIQLSHDATYKAEQQGNDIVLSLTGKADTASDQAAASESSQTG